MNKQLVIFGIVVLLLVVGLSGCNEISNPLTGNDDNRFVGTWKDENSATSVFFSDGTGSLSGMTFQWEIKDNKLVREMYQGEISIVFDYQFSDNDTSLTLTDVSSGTTFNYTKQ